MKKTILNYLEDILLFSGLAIMVGATFLWSTIAGFYAAGFSLFSMGLYFAKYPIGRR